MRRGCAVPGTQLLQRKVGILTFIAAAEMEAADILLVCLAAACDPAEPVSKQGIELLKKRCAIDSPKPLGAGGWDGWGATPLDECCV